MPTLIAATRKTKYEQLIVVAVHYYLADDGDPIGERSNKT
jgi:hypothetical protein